MAILSGQLDPGRYETVLVAGRTGAGEAAADHLAADLGAHLVTIPSLGPEIRPLDDLRALARLIALVWRLRPDIVHTHTAKAGFLGRLAALLGPRPRPQIVHTFHGHVLEGYFGRTKNLLYRRLERLAARASTVLVGVSQATVDDLVRLGVAAPERFRVVPLGLRLDDFLRLGEEPDARAPLRRAVGAGPEDVVAAFVGRLVSIKRVDLALDAVARARHAGAPIRLLVVGDGPLRPALERHAADLGIADAVHFAGYLADMPSVVAATDLALLTSDNEGTPVALIEAAAGARPAVATDVGGVAGVVVPTAGRLAPRGRPEPLARALSELAADRALRLSLGRGARDHVRDAFSSKRLLADIDALYRSILPAPRSASRN